MKKRILIVEDTEDNRAILRDLLTFNGFDLIEAADGESGVAMAVKHRPDLILMDIQLPILNGYEATRRIRTVAELRHVPIIAITSYAMAGDAVRAIEAGCTAYVAKPFSPRAVLARIREYIP